MNFRLLLNLIKFLIKVIVILFLTHYYFIIINYIDKVIFFIQLLNYLKKYKEQNNNLENLGFSFLKNYFLY
jgi:hypothetical protein